MGSGTLHPRTTEALPTGSQLDFPREENQKKQRHRIVTYHLYDKLDIHETSSPNFTDSAHFKPYFLDTFRVSTSKVGTFWRCNIANYDYSQSRDSI